MSKAIASSSSGSLVGGYRPSLRALRAARGEKDAKDMSRRYKTLVALKKR